MVLYIRLLSFKKTVNEEDFVVNSVNSQCMFCICVLFSFLFFSHSLSLSLSGFANGLFAPQKHEDINKMKVIY